VHQDDVAEPLEARREQALDRRERRTVDAADLASRARNVEAVHRDRLVLY